MVGVFRRIARSEFAGQNLALGGLVVAGLFFLGVVIVTPLDLISQVVFGLLTITVMFLIKGHPSRGVTLILISLSVVVSTRYIWWRLTQTLDFASPLEAFLGMGLIAAELYAWLALVLGYIQTAWPLNRPPVAMPEDLAEWPTVDLLIPTYNEPISIVQNTVFGALSVDYPPEKLRIYILDDGRREEFREFAEALGIGYITRDNNTHAKAGNLNHALGLTDGALLALFDSDHVPNRAFLQLTVGWFLVDPKLALVQTPHHFYSPDPFERNLRGGDEVPNEGLLFYGLIQDGNDLWNASFFCGSCAVIRRSAIESIGGFATATVTEDAHTALCLHRAGWNSAYLRLPLAAGLATERLSIHVGQRMRWARGMTQIFRLDNPCFGRGLSLGQRVCYLNAMLHFFFGVPRFIFLTAPVAYLMFHINIIAASGLMVIAYAVPHLWHATLTNSRLQSRYRHSFWGEIYESVLALYILKPTLMTLINPKRGKFNVTEKGGLLPNDYFDYKIVRPNILVCSLLVIAMLVSFAYWLLNDYGDTEVLFLNIFWGTFNLFTMAAAIAVAREARQVRGSIRHDLVMPAVVHLPNGRTIVTRSRNLSTTGGQFTASRPEGIGLGDIIEIEIPIGESSAVFPARIVGWDRDQLRVMFPEMTLRQQRDIVRIVLCRADAWLDWEDHPVDSPLRSVGQILHSIGGLFVPRRGPPPGRPPGPAAPGPAAGPPPAGEPERARESAMSSIIVVLVLGLGAAAMPGAVPGATSGAALAQAPPAPRGAAAPAPDTAQPPQSRPAQIIPSVAAPQVETRSDQPAAPEPAGEASAPSTGGTQTGRPRVMTLKDLGASSPIRLLGVQGEGSLPFSLRRDEVVTGGKIEVSVAYSPALLPELSHLSMLLNGEVVGSIPLPRDKASGYTTTMTINPVLVQEDNRILFRFIGHYTAGGCEDPLHSTLWLVLSNTSAITLQLQKLTLANELSLLPAPFYDSKDMKPLSLPFVFGGRPSESTLQAAGIVASWFGSVASYKGATFPVSYDGVPAGNAVVFATDTEKPERTPLPDLSGPTISVIPNPNNPEAKLLLVMGRTPQELTAAAQTLALGSVALSGQTQVVGFPDIPVRQPYDAPRWIPMDRPVRFGELVQPTDLQGNGLVPGLLTVNFRTAPDIFVWGNAGVPLVLRYRYPAGTWLNFIDSRLDVSINNSYLRSLPLIKEGLVEQVKDIISPDFVMTEQTVRIPPYYIFGQNQLQFYYDLRPVKHGECTDALPNNVQESIDPDSTIDLSKTGRFTTLPNLAYFVNSGYPFTKWADLSQTAVVIPDQLTPADVQVYLTLMGLMGDSTGFPVVRVTVVTPDAVDQVANKDLIVLGAVSRQKLIERWSGNSRLRVEGGGLRVGMTSALDRVYTTLDPNAEQERARVDQLLVSQGDDLATMIGMESPLSSGHTVVMITGSTPEKQMTVLKTFRNRDLNPLIQGDLMVATADRVTSFRVGSEYSAGRLPGLMKIRWWLGNSPLILILFTLIGVLIMALVAYWLLNRIATRRLAGRPAA